MDIQTLIQTLEASLHQQKVRLDEAALNALLADDFVEFGASGQSWTKDEVITGLLNEVLLTRMIYDFELRALTTDIFLATYRCGSSSADGVESLSLRSSIWRRHLDGWQMVFHQGTEVPI